MAKLQVKTPGRAFWLASILLALVLGFAAFGTRESLNSAEKTALLEMEQRLDFKLKDGATAAVVWYRGLMSHAERLTGMDMVRLFAVESQSGKDPALAESATTLRSILQDLTQYTNFIAVSLVNADMSVLLSIDQTPQKLNPEQETAVRATFATGKPGVSAAYATPDGLRVEMTLPVQAPDYVDKDPGNTPVAVLLMTSDIGLFLRDTWQAGIENEEDVKWHLIQQGTQGLEELRPDGKLQNLEQWELVKGDLPLSLRQLPGGKEVYAKGHPLPSLPWMLAATIDSQQAEQRYKQQRIFTLLTSAQATVICLLLIGFVWWRLVWQRERVVSGELACLNSTVNRQNQLLESIDNTLPGGVVLVDTRQIILHVNRSFAAMLDHSPKALLGISLPTLFQEPMIGPLSTALSGVLETGESRTFTSTQQSSTGFGHWQVVCTPFHDAEETLAGVVSVFQDITDEVEKEARKQAYTDKIITVLTRTIEAVDPYLCGQSAFTQYLCDNIVKQFSVSEKDIQTIRTATHLYQIGLIQVPKDILNKTQALTPHERTILERHVDYACEALASIDFDPDVLTTIRQVYERLDGSGYPQKLHGDQITLPARILAVANTFCALIRPRSYRDAKRTDEALRILTTEPPTYDARVVAVLRDFLGTPEGADFITALYRQKAPGEKTLPPL